MKDMQDSFDIRAFLTAALAEDIGSGDVTGNAVIPADAVATFVLNAREPLVAAGLVYLPLLFELVNARAKVTLHVADGDKVAAGTKLATVSGPARALLAGERTAINLLQQLCGVATLTRQYVEAVAGTGARILDTRKTLPGWRHLQKYAVRCGGGHNHRMGLYDAVLIKDNHIAVAGSVTAAVEAARAYISQHVIPADAGIRAGAGSVLEAAQTPGRARGDTEEGRRVMIEVECDTLAQLDEALAAKVDIVLLDNMDNVTLAEGVRRAKAAGVVSEASGNVNLQTVRAIAQTGVDMISVGKLTHSAVAVDIGMDEVS